MWPTFFMRVRPASRNAKPACMNITRTAATMTQTVLAAIPSSSLVTRLHLLELLPGPVVDDVRRRPTASTIPSPDSLPLRAASTIASATASAISSRTRNISRAFGRKRDSNTRPRYSCVIPRCRP